MLLKFSNKILENIGKLLITDMTEFKNIDRADIVKDINKQTLTIMEKEICEIFDKTKCRLYAKTNGIVMNCFRAMVKDVGLTLTISKKCISKNTVMKTHYYYTVTE